MALGSIDRATNGLVQLNHADGRDVGVVVVDPGVQIQVPVHVVHLTAPGDSDRRQDSTVSVHPRTIVDIGADSHVDIIETYCGLDGRAVTNASTTIRIGSRADADHCRVQIESPTTVHVGHTRIEQDAGSRVRSCSVTLGADIGRNAIDVHLDGTEARTELTGLDVTTGRQRHDTVVTVDHAASRCLSNQRFTCVVDDHGRSSFTGEIIVRPGTIATDAHQSIRNLVLSPHGEADARPWLQIFADDVKCTHGASTGRLDDDALFYVRSRGISAEAARAMLIEAVVRDITDAITDESLRAHIASLVAASRECPVTTVPYGQAVVLDGGGRVSIAQRLGSSITVRTEMGMLLRIDADADALGLRPEGRRDAAEGPFEMAHVIDALHGVYDPEIPVSIVELGLVYRCEELSRPDGTRRIEIDMSMTAPGCGMGDVLRNDAWRPVRAVPGVDDVDVTLVWDPPWSVQRMSEAASLQLGLL